MNNTFDNFESKYILLLNLLNRVNSNLLLDLLVISVDSARKMIEIKVINVKRNITLNFINNY